MDNALRTTHSTRSSISSTASSGSWVSQTDPADFISPATETIPWDATTTQAPDPQDANSADEGEFSRPQTFSAEGNRGMRPTAGKQRRISSAFEADSTTELWLRMVELQQRYGCYRSARMQAVACAECAADLMPSKACLDLLNDDITDDELPEEGWRLLGRFVVRCDEEPTGQHVKPGWKVWRRS